MTPSMNTDGDDIPNGDRGTLGTSCASALSKLLSSGEYVYLSVCLPICVYTCVHVYLYSYTHACAHTYTSVLMKSAVWQETVLTQSDL